MAEEKFTPGPWEAQLCWPTAYGVAAFIRAECRGPNLPIAALHRHPRTSYTGTENFNTSVEIAHANAHLIAAAPDGFALAQLVKRYAQREELSTHVEVTFDPSDAATILNAAEAFLSKVASPSDQERTGP